MVFRELKETSQMIVKSDVLRDAMQGLFVILSVYHSDFVISIAIIYVSFSLVHCYRAS